MVNIEIRLIIFFESKDGKALYSHYKQDQEYYDSDHKLIIAKFRIQLGSVQSLSHVQLFVTPMDCSMPGFSVHHRFPELDQTYVHQVGDAIQSSHPLSSSSPPAIKDPASGSFPMTWLFASGGQSIGVSASASALPMNI